MQQSWRLLLLGGAWSTKGIMCGDEIARRFALRMVTSMKACFSTAYGCFVVQRMRADQRFLSVSLLLLLIHYAAKAAFTEIYPRGAR